MTNALHQDDNAMREEDRAFLTKFFYGLIGVAASLAFALVLYWALRLDSAITNVITNTYDTPLYFWPYAALTFLAIVLFGLNVSLFAYRWRRFGPPKLKAAGGTGLGSLVGVAASACPVCGSTLLATLGIAGGLAAFPLGGLELKALSVVLLALPVWLIRKDVSRLQDKREFALVPADGGQRVCPAPRDHSFKEADRPLLFGLMAGAVVLSLVFWNMLETEPILASVLRPNGIVNADGNTLYSANVSQSGNPLIAAVTEQVLPEQGFQSKIALTDSVVKLVQNGVIDKNKFLAIYESRGGLPSELEGVLDEPSATPMLLTRANANYYVNLMWPLGLANYMESNGASPINGTSLFNFASTGGWNLGREENGGAYFNKFNIIALTPAQEALVTDVAQNTYRPCCNNSTFFQDCNHGSALLGLLQLGAAQGLTEDELYREALAFNSFWFPHTYIQTALYFEAVEDTAWDDVDPRLIMGKSYSSIGGWYENVDAKVKALGLVPEQKSGGGCGV